MAEQKDLLIEIGTEELPPKALQKLAESFTRDIRQGLAGADLSFVAVQPYASPRRLAVLVRGCDTQQADKQVERRGPALKAAFGEDGAPSKAAEGFARSCGVSVADLDKVETGKGAWLYFRSEQKGQAAEALIPGIIDAALAALPIPKRMRWGAGEEQFVRPVHWIVAMLGEEVIPATILGVDAGNVTYGHRFHHPDALVVSSPAKYAEILQDQGYVVADFEQRRAMIRQQVESKAAELGGQALIDDGLLDEVTALVEWPVALAGSFEEKFLEVPHETLITTMEDNQKYFAIFDSDGKLLPHFITIANIESKNPQMVIEGNERVIRPRFADAVFFWEQDQKQKLGDRIESLKTILFQQKLGTLYDKSERVKHLAAEIAGLLGVDVNEAKRAAELAKCDLMTDMVGEFPKLQGIAGRYYALLDDEPGEVAAAMDEQYMPRHAGDDLPDSGVGQVLALADKIDTLVGIFGIGQKPTGTKDPFALRRAALGVLRIIIERELPLDLKALYQFAADSLGDKLEDPAAVDSCFDYTLERLKAYYQDQGVAVDLIDAVLAQSPTSPLDFDKRIKAVTAFRQLDQAESLAAANKRIGNILKKVDGELPAGIDESLLREPAEKALYQQLKAMEPEVLEMFAAGDYEAALLRLAGLRESVDTFFDDVMVMVEDEAQRNNRLALLNQMRELFLRVADLSRLQY
jgi:glycyl-tRNA synthetase beta chain